MNIRQMVVGMLVLSMSVAALTVSVDAQTEEGWTVPRTPAGRPDLQGVWANNSVTPLERPEAWVDKSTLTDEELAEFQTAAAEVTASGNDAVFGDLLAFAAIEGIKDAESYDTGTGNYNQFWLSDRDFDNRTSLVTDPPNGRLPQRTPEAVRAGRGGPAPFITEKADSWTDRPLSERCITYGVPSLFAGYNSFYQIFQSPNHAVVMNEMIHDARVIPLGGQPHPSQEIRQLHGDSRGHWDGDTLVVETTNYSSMGVSGMFWSSSEAITITERFTRVGPDTLNYEVTFDDQGTLTSPWTIMIPLKRSDDSMFEYACHEGNLGMEGILSGYRAQEQALAATDENQP